MSTFGASAPGKVCFEKFGITAGKTVETAKNLIHSKI
jgi:transketolase